MSSLFGFEAPRPVLFVIAFAIILALVVLFGVVFRKLTGARLMMPSNDRSRSRQPRLGIVDVYDLDRQRQLILLRRDNVEHLLLIGGPNDVVIETNIVRVAGARIPAPSADTAPERFEPSLEQAPRAPQVEQNGRPSIESQLAAQLGAFVRRPSEESDVDEELSPVAAVSAPAAAHPEPVLKPDAVAVSTTSVIPGLRAEARNPSSQSTPPAPPAAVERPEPRPHFTPPPFQSRPTPVPPAPPVQPEPVRPPQPAEDETATAPERPAPDAALLSDMAKQLEEALKRPAIPVPPPPVVLPAPAAIAPAVAHGDIRDEEDLLDPPQIEEEHVSRHEEDERVEEENLAPRPEAAAPVQPSPPVEPARPAPPPPISAPLPPQAREPAPASQKPADPFSVEDIEAEFARLLGRPLDPNKKG
ncbi:flagellar biosynthetic protein FliO [Microvirga sp. BT689]|uniref:flagellar biosynthetic protein FliO n=1 Tax=Microvirga arvi TaxID=2778731 RepID=UPI001950724E|nr:flagellar biosynthetic protein FliO [Microvirga arvi]MBM6580507.1 flagellar biosynthetic protein FliO [Microvirga arvi]